MTHDVCDLDDESQTGVFEIACTNASLRRATRQLALLYDEAFEPSGLKATQFALLFCIEQLGGAEGPALQAVAGKLGIGISALTHALRPIVRDGLVELSPDARDKRTKRAALTPLGRSRLQHAALLWAESNRRVEALLGATEAALLRGLADRISGAEFASAFKIGFEAPVIPAEEMAEG